MKTGHEQRENFWIVLNKCIIINLNELESIIYIVYIFL